jgi:hypothetical protein
MPHGLIARRVIGNASHREFQVSDSASRSTASSSYVIPHLLLPEMLDHDLARNGRLADPIAESCYAIEDATGLIVRFRQPELDIEIDYAPMLED